jgi:hypothetical protein
VKRIEAERSALPKLGKHKGEAALSRVQRALEELEAIDFFPGEARRQAQDALQRFQGEVLQLGSPGEPRAVRGRLKRVDPARYQDRTWATRKDIWIDRMASAWLIKRFIDKQARFTWLDSPGELPRKAVGFDFDGAEFTHVGSRITFEVLIACFGLQADAALASIAAAIHYLDAGGIPVADARGLETVLRGIRERSRSDDERATKAMQVFDHLYAAYSSSS